MALGRREESASWVEPSTRIPLRYGSHRVRYVLAVVALIAGGILIQFASAYTLPLLVAGVLASVAGWVIVPSRGWRRTVSVAPGLLGVTSLLNGAQSGALVALTLVCWLLVRIRPLRSYPVVVLPAIAAYLMSLVFPQYTGRGAVAIVVIFTVVASAWIGRSLAALRVRRLR